MRLEQLVGQRHILGEDKLLVRMIRSNRLSSVIFYGPPGTGKTSLARVISKETGAPFVKVNAVDSSVSELRKIINEARRLVRLQRTKTLLFVDEIHRFNKAQQDVLMPDVEDGTLVLIGATTHNPSFVVNGPLLSRATVFELKPLTNEDLVALIHLALSDKSRGLGEMNVKISDEAVKHFVRSASGDGRKILNSLEIAVLSTEPTAQGVINVGEKEAEESSQKKIVYHDRDGDYHYDIASAFIKSMRGSDPDASIYWLAKMLYGGEDPRFIIRRILILASEDIGNADPQALVVATSALQALEFVGMPEARIILGQVVTYMALAPKSNASYMAINKALEDLKQDTTRDVPDHLRDSHYPGAKGLGRGEGYKYPHNYRDAFVEQAYMPHPTEYYHPKNIGFEKNLAEKLRELRHLRNKG